MTKIWEVIKKYWQWFLAALLVAGGFFFGLSMKKRPVIISGKNPEKEDIEEEIAEKELEAVQEAEEKKEEALEDFRDSQKDVLVDVEKKTEQIRNDPEAVNQYLKGVGDSVRKGDQ